jgi:hypothetical protein
MASGDWYDTTSAPAPTPAMWGPAPVAGQNGASAGTPPSPAIPDGVSQRGPYAAASENTSASGGTVGYQAEAGAGWRAAGSTDTPWGGKASGSADVGPQANAGVGSYKDPTGKQTYGARADATTGQASGQVDVPGGKVGGEVAGPSAGAGASANDSTAQVGAGASAATVAVNAGSTGTNVDESARFGVSPGVGAAARVHYGDSDGDGHREYGVGVDVGPFTADVKSEDPLRTMATQFMGGPLGMAAAEAVTGMGTDASGKPINLTDRAVAAGTEAVGAAQAMGQDAAQAAQDLWNHMTE